MGGLAAILVIVLGLGLAAGAVSGILVTVCIAAWLATRERISQRLRSSVLKRVGVMVAFSAAFIVLEWPFLALLALALLTRPSDWG
jgi:hypothetical protein